MKLHSLLASLVPASALLLAGAAVPRAGDLTPGAAPAAPPAAAVVPPGTAPVEPAAIPVEPASPAAAPDAALALEIAAPVPPEPLALRDVHLDPRRGRYVAPLGEGRAILTLDPRLQTRLERSLAAYRVPWGATVLLEVGTGRVLALAEHSQAEPARRGIALSAIAPAASIFKIVTAAALLERGVLPDDEVCYHGGRRRLQPRLLADDPRRDRRCTSLASAFGHSTNVVFAKLADRGLDAEALRAAARRFGFDEEISFALPVERSIAEIPDDPFGLANAAAGFGAVTLSPVHAALLGSIVANGGLELPPLLVDDVEGGPVPAARPATRVVDEAVAAKLAAMMRNTVSEGTARRVFRRPGPALRGVEVAGKTGSLAQPSPYRDYSWFVGFAPAERPEVVVATVVVNDRLWHARAPTVAREALEAFFGARFAGLPPGSIRTAAAP
ncbi:MAG TPA: penicillin-binding transpeptidase domain-containing protein [Anaeromyxobacter sp.]|nr:penicillin-binding transpeptidase domain-containing protein [Anaeromyxobacter sp.]